MRGTNRKERKVNNITNNIIINSKFMKEIIKQKSFTEMKSIF